MRNFLTLIALISVNIMFCQKLSVTKSKSLKILPTLKSEVMYVPNLVLEEGSLVEIEDQILYVTGNIIVKGKGEFRMKPKSIVYCKGNSDIVHERIIELRGKSKVSNFKYFKSNLVKNNSKILIIKGGHVVAKGEFGSIKEIKLDRDIYDIYIKGSRYLSNQYLK